MQPCLGHIPLGRSHLSHRIAWLLRATQTKRESVSQALLVNNGKNIKPQQKKQCKPSLVLVAIAAPALRTQSLFFIPSPETPDSIVLGWQIGPAKTRADDVGINSVPVPPS
jgi:hypothetical protein